jgi:hypothetical protein
VKGIQVPTAELEQRRVYDWIDEPRREADVSIDRGASSVAAASALEESVKGVLRSRTLYTGLPSDPHHARDEVDPEQEVWDLARAARAKAAKARFDRATALAAQLNITRSQLYSKALAEFIEKHGEVLESYADVSGTASDYWKVSEYTDEEFNAILEADRLTPELAERYKDLLGD